MLCVAVVLVTVAFEGAWVDVLLVTLRVVGVVGVVVTVPVVEACVVVVELAEAVVEV
jgi:hypothetical protein